MKRRFIVGSAGMLVTALVLFGAVLSWGLLAPDAVSASEALVAPAMLTAHGSHTDTVGTAAVVVQFDDRRSIVRLIDFAEPISGVTALERTGLRITLADTGFGPAVCAIEDVGCPAGNCFCNPDLFWNYNFWDGSTWQGYPVGAAQSVISTTGAIEGWRWGAFGSAQLPAAQAIAAASALEWLRGQQDASTGGFGGSLGSAVEAMMALGANGEKISAWAPEEGSRTLADFVRLRATRYSRNGVAEAGKLAVAAASAGGCRTVRSVQPSFYFSNTLGTFHPDSGFNAWAILGTAALSQTIPVTAVDALAAQMLPNGGWEWQAGFGADTNTTAIALQALIAAGRAISSSEVVSGLAFLKSAQQPGGGFTYDPAKPEQGSDANSTAYAVQAIAAAGENPTGESWIVGGNTPIAFLLSLQLPDGSVEWQPGTGANLLATAQAVPALLGRPYPLAIREVESCMRQSP